MHILVQNERLVETKRFFCQKSQFCRKNAVMCRINIGAPAASPDFLKDYAAVRSVWEERPWRVAWAASKKADLVYAHSHSFRWRFRYIGKQPKFKELTRKMKKSFRNIGKQSKFKTTYAKNEEKRFEM